MALWIDDLLPDQDKYLDLSFRARACLVEVWCYAKRSRSDGVIKVERLHRASDAFAPEVMDELIAVGWWHEGGKGCGDETCPKGISGYVVLHDFLEHQESAKRQSKRISDSRKAAQNRADARRAFMESHVAVRGPDGRIVKWEELPQSPESIPQTPQTAHKG